jgi:hypothetical protein
VSANSDILFGNHLVFCLGASACTRGGVYHAWSEHIVLHVQTGLKNAVRCPGVVITQCFSFTTFSHLKATPPSVFEKGTYNIAAQCCTQV